MFGSHENLNSEDLDRAVLHGTTVSTAILLAQVITIVLHNSITIEPDLLGNSGDHAILIVSAVQITNLQPRC